MNKNHYPLLLIAFLLASCNSPVQSSPTEQPVEPTQTQALPTATGTFMPTALPTETKSPPTPIPCDPLSVDYCIIDWGFRFQRPILPPGNDAVDLTYLYATTQNGARDPHHGVEFQNAFGTPVHAAGDGEVVFAGSDKSVKFSPWTNFYGNVIVIRHTDDFYTLYAHLSNIFVSAGNAVKAGERIGEVGASGGAAGSHLHFEVRRGGDYTDYFSTENPELWLIPQSGTGALSITLKMDAERNYERPLVITRYVNDSAAFTYYISSYAKGFEHNPEDAVLGGLPPGRYKIAFNDSLGLRERMVMVEAGRLTTVVFE
ncbi:hypothetical protein FBQ99_01495 [Chloroflexi bacterium CFX2]|nr:hypothetical protein [Chloroflexi bacterium CFX2]